MELASEEDETGDGGEEVWDFDEVGWGEIEEEIKRESAWVMIRRNDRAQLLMIEGI